MDPLFPFIQLPPPASHGATATAAFHKALETGAGHNGRRVKIDYSQSATPHEKGRSIRQNMNDGTRDIGNAQAPVLLFRGLDPLSGPQAIHQAMRGSSGTGKEGAKGMKRIVLIKDKVTMASFGFAFVEFVDIQVFITLLGKFKAQVLSQSAAAVLAATMSPQIHPSGFRISDRPVAGSFAHPYSFQPVSDYILRDEAAITSSVAFGGAEGAWVRYWDESSTVAVLEFEVETPVPSQETAPSKEKKGKKKKGFFQVHCVDLYIDIFRRRNRNHSATCCICTTYFRETGNSELQQGTYRIKITYKYIRLVWMYPSFVALVHWQVTGAPLGFAFSSADDVDPNESGDVEKVNDSDKKGDPNFKS